MRMQWFRADWCGGEVARSARRRSSTAFSSVRGKASCPLGTDATIASQSRRPSRQHERDGLARDLCFAQAAHLGGVPSERVLDQDLSCSVVRGVAVRRPPSPLSPTNGTPRHANSPDALRLGGRERQRADQQHECEQRHEQCDRGGQHRQHEACGPPRAQARRPSDADASQSEHRSLGGRGETATSTSSRATPHRPHA